MKRVRCLLNITSYVQHLKIVRDMLNFKNIDILHAASLIVLLLETISDVYLK